MFCLCVDDLRSYSGTQSGIHTYFDHCAVHLFGQQMALQR